jgi:hypothetical protein
LVRKNKKKKPEFSSVLIILVQWIDPSYSQSQASLKNHSQMRSKKDGRLREHCKNPSYTCTEKERTGGETRRSRDHKRDGRDLQVKRAGLDGPGVGVKLREEVGRNELGKAFARGEEEARGIKGKRRRSSSGSRSRSRSRSGSGSRDATKEQSSKPGSARFSTAMAHNELHHCLLFFFFLFFLFFLCFSVSIFKSKLSLKQNSSQKTHTHKSQICSAKPGIFF